MKMETALAALLGFVVGQMVKFFFEPVHRVREAIGKADFVLGYYANVYSNPNEVRTYPVDARDALRQAAIDLRAKAAAVPALSAFAMIRLTPGEQSILRASENLIGLSNNLAGPLTNRNFNEERRKQIVQALHLREWSNKVPHDPKEK